jgi:murein DD-endopeptidase MepM/ murein hydrolase activator NlpD
MSTQLPISAALPTEMAGEAQTMGLKNKLNKLAELGATGTPEEQKAARAQLREAAEGFEAMFANMLLKEMMPDENNMFGEGLGSKTYHQLFVNEMSTLIAGTRQLGLAESVERQVAEQAGLTEESQTESELIPAQTMGRILPQTNYRNRSRSYQMQSDASAAANKGFDAEQGSGFGQKEVSYELPLDGRISSSFGKRNDPFTNTNIDHHGLDIAAAKGSEIKSATPGTVTFSDQ